jgi:hypothetical protein
LVFILFDEYDCILPILGDGDGGTDGINGRFNAI